MMAHPERIFFGLAFTALTCIVLVWTHIYITNYSPSVVDYDTNKSTNNNNKGLEVVVPDNDPRIDITSLGISRDFVYMFILDRTDIGFYRTQKIFDNVVLIAEHPAGCHGLEHCLALHEEFVYLTLHDKVFKTLTLLNKTYKNWNSISKMDDDALVDIRSLNAHHKPHERTYLGHIYTNDYAKGFDITYATGHYYTLGKQLVECVLAHKEEFYGLGTGAEDATVGWVISTFCGEGTETVNVYFYPFIWHKTLDNGKNKRCELAAQIKEPAPQ